MKKERCPECHGRGKVEFVDFGCIPVSFDLANIPEPPKRKLKVCDECGGSGYVMRRGLQPKHTSGSSFDTIITPDMVGLPPKTDPVDPFLKIQQAQMSRLINNMVDQCIKDQFIFGKLSVNTTAPEPPPELDDESRFQRWWEEEQMAKGWRRWGGINQQIAKVWLDEGRGCLHSRFPYKEEVIEEIREKIPRGKKSWNPNEKVWEFSVETIDVLCEILTKYFDEVVDLTRPAPIEIEVTGDPLLSILDEIDKQIIYRLLVKKYHPDTGGDADKMARINQMFSVGKKK